MTDQPQVYADEAGITRPLLHVSPRYFWGGKGPSGFGSATTAEQASQGWDGKGKVVVITGASSGLGAESARVLAARGATLVLLVRNLETTDKVVSGIKAQAPDAVVHVVPCDLTDLSNVAAAAQKVLALNLPINVLMLNAGVMAPPFSLTKQGLEQQIGVNHVAHALLVRYLLPNIVKTASAPGAPQGRIICLSSTGHHLAPRYGLRARDKINSPEGFDTWKAYGQSKLANVLFARELTCRLCQAGVTNVAAVACHPGVIPTTELKRHMGLGDWLTRLFSPLLKNTPQGAATQVFLATRPATITGGTYWADCNVDKSSRLAHDRRVGQRLWSWTDAQIKPFLPQAVDNQEPINWDPAPEDVPETGTAVEQAKAEPSPAAVLTPLTPVEGGAAVAPAPVAPEAAPPGAETSPAPAPTTAPA